MKRVHGTLCQRRSRQSGVALVELALVLPVLLMLSLLVTEIGRAFYQYNTLAKAVRDAVRYLSTQDASIALTDPAKLEVARNLVVYGLPSPGTAAAPLAPGLSLANVPATNISWGWSDSAPRIRTVRIAVTGYQFQPVIPQLFGLSLGNAQGVLPFGTIAAVMRTSP